MIPYRLTGLLFLGALVAYAAVAWATFEMPTSIAEAEVCGFTSADFDSSGRLGYAPTAAWLVSVRRTGEYWSALSVALAVAFVGLVSSSARRLGTGVAAGATTGSGLLALAALCLSCLAPVLSAVGLSLAATALAGVPKWLMALNTLVLTAWGTLVVSRRLAACPAGRPVTHA